MTKQTAPAKASALPQRKSLNDIIKESNNKEAEALKAKIDDLRKQRNDFILEAKSYRRKLEYKEAEYAAISKFLESTNSSKESREMGQLKRLKNRLEFKLSTEARMSLQDERDIVRKIDEIDLQLKKVGKVIHLSRKVEFVKGDLETFKNKLIEADKKIADLDIQLDDLYRSLRRVLKIDTSRAKPAAKPKRQQGPSAPEINMEDIAIIKTKGKTKEIKEETKVE